MVVDVGDLAQRMLADFDAKTPGQLFCKPLDLTIIQAYALQAEVTRLREKRGEKVIGYKVGCTSPAIHQQLGIDQPIFARLFDSGCHPCAAQLSHGSYANLAVEGELAVRLGSDLPTSPRGAEECQAAIAEIFPVIELHHYVLRSAQPSVVELIANGGMHAGLVLAEEEAGPDALTNIDSLCVWIDGDCMGSVAGAELLRLTCHSLFWLANRLAEMELSLVKGQVILTGSLLNLYPVRPRNRIVIVAPPVGRSSATIAP